MVRGKRGGGQQGNYVNVGKTEKLIYSIGAEGRLRLPIKTHPAIRARCVRNQFVLRQGQGSAFLKSRGSRKPQRIAIRKRGRKDFQLDKGSEKDFKEA